MNNDVKAAETGTAAALLAGEELATAKHRLTADVKRLTDDGRPFRVHVDGSLQSLEGFLPAPVSVRGDLHVYDADSFVDYVQKFKDADTVVFADKVGRAFTAVIDYHAVGKPRWGRHRAVLAARETDPWKRWTAASGKQMTQAAMAQFIEDNIPDIASPPGAQLVEIARTLEAKKNVEFVSVIRPQNGSVSFHYNETVQGNARGGDLAIPEEFILGLIPFEGCEKYKVVARLRYSIQAGGKLAIWFDLLRLEDIVEEAFKEITGDVTAGVGDTLILSGPAPARATAE